jgi:hypothetical protein
MLARILLVSVGILIGAALGQSLTAQASAPAGVVPIQFTDGTNVVTLVDAGGGQFAILVSP